MNDNIFNIAHPLYFESVSNYRITPEYAAVLQSVVTDGWTIVREGYWLGAFNSGSSPPQGFKIHVSTVPAHAVHVLRLVASACVQRGFRFKVAADPLLLHVLNSRTFDPGSSGKFMTIYPPTTAEFSAFIEDLYDATKDQGHTGPYILSDRRYKDSKILYYRYGGFANLQRLSIDGTKIPMIVSPTGEQVPDIRAPFFQLPHWVPDPFVDAFVERRAEPILRGRYRVDAALHNSNSGGLYAGTDLLTGEPVIIKEARPHTAPWSDGAITLDACRFLEREWTILNRLQQLNCIPRVIDFFTEWEHSFLVEQPIQATTFWHYWTDPGNVVFPYVARPDRMATFVAKFRTAAASLIDVVEAVHEAGVIIGDLSPHNVLLEEGTFKMWLIDFESAIVAGHDNGTSRVTAYSCTRPGTHTPSDSGETA